VLGELEGRIWDRELGSFKVFTRRLCTLFLVCSAVERGRLEAGGRGQKISEPSALEIEGPPTRLALRRECVRGGSIGWSGAGVRSRRESGGSWRWWLVTGPCWMRIRVDEEMENIWKTYEGM